MRVLITGVAGFIGSHLAEALLARGDEVVGIDNFNDYYDPAIKRQNLAIAQASTAFQLHEIDICDEAALREVFSKTSPEVVVHLAARAGVRPSLQDPNLYHRVNVIGGQHMLDACRDFAPSHLVFASTSSVYGGSMDVPFQETNPVMKPVSPYAATKRLNELMAHVYHHVYGLQVTMLRFFTVYGPRQRPDMAIHLFTKKILAGEPIALFGDGSSARDYTYVDDIIDGVVKAVDKPFGYEIFNLGEQHTTRLDGLVTLIEQAVGKPAQIDWKPFQMGDVEITYADISHAREKLGYAPRFSMEEGIARFVEWFEQKELA